jgi:hypothetical protein
VDDNDKIKENDFSALELNAPDSREKRIEDSIVPVDTAIENIVNKLKKRHRAENNLFIADCMTIELPESFHVEFLTHWEMGDLYYAVKNPKDTVFMYFDFALRSKSGHSHDFDVDSLTKDFTLDTKTDTISEGPRGRILKRQIVVLQTKRRLNNKYYYPYVVEFSCYPDFVPPLTCEKIISSAKTNHDCLEGIE